MKTRRLVLLGWWLTAWSVSFAQFRPPERLPPLPSPVQFTPPPATIAPDPIHEWPVAVGGNGHFYQAVAASNGINWPGAEAWAEAHGGYLATIESAAENAFVFQLIDYPKYWTRSTAQWSPAPGGKAVAVITSRGPWLGGLKAPSATRPAGGWQWVHGGGPFTYTNWAAQQPNNIDGAENRLIYFSWGANRREAYWNDLPESSPRPAGFVVEYDTNPAAPLGAANASTGNFVFAAPRDDGSSVATGPTGTAPGSFSNAPQQAAHPELGVKQVAVLIAGERSGPAVPFTDPRSGQVHFFQAIEVPDGIDYVDARASAIARGGYLAAITSATENSFVFHLIDDPRYWVVNAPYNNRNLGPWLGGHRLPGNLPDKGWYWTGDATPFTYTNWAPTQPDNGGLGNEDKLHFISMTPTDRQPTWNDVGAEYLLRSYIVEYNFDPAMLMRK